MPPSEYTYYVPTTALESSKNSSPRKGKWGERGLGIKIAPCQRELGFSGLITAWLVDDTKGYISFWA